MKERQTLIEPGVNADVFGSQRPTAVIPLAYPLPVLQGIPTPTPADVRRARINFFLDRAQQEVLPGDLRMLVEVMAEALRQSVGRRHPIPGGSPEPVRLIWCDHGFPLLERQWFPSGFLELSIPFLPQPVWAFCFLESKTRSKDGCLHSVS